MSLLSLCMLTIAGGGAVFTRQEDHDFWWEYEAGELGNYPQLSYNSTRVTSPLVHVSKWNESCSHAYTLLCPHGPHIADNRALLLDHQGNLVWHHAEKGSIHNFQIQTYNGNEYISFWVGDDGFFGSGRGFYKLFDQTYTHTHTITAANGHDGDYHEFTITNDNTALITAYVKKPANLTLHHRENGYIWDCIFQEIDIATNSLLYEWRASDHFSFSDIAVDSWTLLTGTAGDPWDWFHLNSVEKDVYGNYLIAARYTNAITYLDGETGKPIWQLGGVKNTFIDLSQGNATRFLDPHMARWDDNYTTITVFDNVEYWTQEKSKKQSKGVKISLDLPRKIARATINFQHPEDVFALSEGSLARLENGNYLVGYGSTPVFAEFSPSGQHLCETGFAPMRTNGETYEATDAVDTYRLYKHSWIGRPRQPPAVRIVDEVLYLNWNGATEVHTWEIVGRKRSRNGATSNEAIGQYRRQGFETRIPLGASSDYDSFLLAARDRHGELIRAWKTDVDGTLQQLLHESDIRQGTSLLIKYTYIVIVIVAIGYFVLGRWSLFSTGRKHDTRPGPDEHTHRLSWRDTTKLKS
jgi:hypothetical protein